MCPARRRQPWFSLGPARTDNLSSLSGMVSLSVSGSGQPLFSSGPGSSGQLSSRSTRPSPSRSLSGSPGSPSVRAPAALVEPVDRAVFVGVDIRAALVLLRRSPDVTALGQRSFRRSGRRDRDRDRPRAGESALSSVVRAVGSRRWQTAELRRAGHRVMPGPPPRLMLMPLECTQRTAR